MEDGQRAAHYAASFRTPIAARKSVEALRLSHQQNRLSFRPIRLSIFSAELVEADEPVAVVEPEPTATISVKPVLIIDRVVDAYLRLTKVGMGPPSYRAIAEDIGIPVANVAPHISHARKRAGCRRQRSLSRHRLPWLRPEPEAPKPQPPRGGATKGIEVSPNFTIISGPQGCMEIPEKFGRMLAVMASGYLFAEDRLQKAAGAHARTWPADQLKYHRAALLEIGIVVDHQKGVGWRIKIAETVRSS
jgi:hypothetical protein